MRKKFTNLQKNKPTDFGRNCNLNLSFVALCDGLRGTFWYSFYVIYIKVSQRIEIRNAQSLKIKCSPVSKEFS